MALNAYAYTENNPATRTDPSGHVWVDEETGISDFQTDLNRRAFESQQAVGNYPQVPLSNFGLDLLADQGYDGNGNYDWGVVGDSEAYAREVAIEADRQWYQDHSLGSLADNPGLLPELHSESEVSDVSVKTQLLFGSSKQSNPLMNSMVALNTSAITGNYDFGVRSSDQYLFKPNTEAGNEARGIALAIDTGRWGIDMMGAAFVYGLTIGAATAGTLAEPGGGTVAGSVTGYAIGVLAVNTTFGQISNYLGSWSNSYNKRADIALYGQPQTITQVQGWATKIPGIGGLPKSSSAMITDFALIMSGQ